MIIDIQETNFSRQENNNNTLQSSFDNNKGDTSLNNKENLFNKNIKSREFGKDITNAFMGARKSLGQPNISRLNQANLKQTKLTSFNNNNICTTKSLVVDDKSLNTFKANLTINTNNPQNNFINFNNNTVKNLQQSINLSNLNNSNKFNNILNNNNTIKPKEKENDNKIKVVNYNLIANPNNSNSSVQAVSEYSIPIFNYIKETEALNPHFYPDCNYMKSVQYDINEKMRAILLDWLVEVHLKFKLLPETLFLTINLIDRYLSKKSIHRTNLQLVGVSAMLIACKYEEIYAPEVKDFVYITDKAYTHKNVLDMESDILSTLEFNITMPSSYRFVEMFNYFIKYDELIVNFMQYLLDLCLVNYKMMKYKCSLIAAAIVFVASKLLHKEKICIIENIDSDMEKLYGLSGFSEEEIKECAKEVCFIYDCVDKTGLFAIKKKFSLPKYKEVAKIKFGGNK